MMESQKSCTKPNAHLRLGGAGFNIIFRGTFTSKDFHPFLVHPKMVSLVVFEKSLEIKQFFAKMML